MSSTPAVRILGRFPWGIERPVFVIAPPRSGSTFLLECLVQFRELTGFTDQEGTALWRRVLPYEKRATVSDAIGPEEFDERRRRALKLLFYARGLARSPNLHGYERLLRMVRQPRMRYLDKTISNVFRLDLLQEMFPDATFLYLIREPRANLASMVNGWGDPRFCKPALLRYVRAARSPLQCWTYAAPPGWREMLGRSVAEVCAWSWQQHAEAILAFRAERPSGPLVHYEDLVRNPFSVLRELASHLGVELTPQVADYLARPPLSRTTVTIPGSTMPSPEVADQVDQVLPSVAGTAARFGY